MKFGRYGCCWLDWTDWTALNPAPVPVPVAFPLRAFCARKYATQLKGLRVVVVSGECHIFAANQQKNI